MLYTVYHKNLITPNGTMKRFDAFRDNAPETLAAFPDGFTMVATVDARDVGEVFQLTNHIEHDWRENPEVIEVFVPRGARSTSVGDVYVAENGERFTVNGAGLGTF